VVHSVAFRSGLHNRVTRVVTPNGIQQPVKRTLPSHRTELNCCLAALHGYPLLAYSVEELDVRGYGHVRGGTSTLTEVPIVDPGSI
jgi:hypothetical protein